jgi:glycosyltransferase involved in cell wall biosynthesis
MRILWIKTDFLHPTSRGGQIRTLETLRRLHARHEVHYVAFENPAQPEGPARAGEYCSFAYPVPHAAPPKGSFAFAMQVPASLFSPLPLAVSRWVAPAMRRQIRRLREAHRFDSVVCDFVAPSPNLDSLAGCVLFQHNVETMIWRRMAEHAPGPLRRAYFGLQAARMFRLEKKACLEAAHIVAVSDADARAMRDMFGVRDISSVPTGVDIDYFRRPEPAQRTPAQHALTERTPVKQTPAEWAPAERTPVERTPAERTPSEHALAQRSLAEYTLRTPAEHALAERTLAERTLAERTPAEHTLAQYTPAEPTPAGPPPCEADLVFVGSMDWLPNVDGVEYFVRDILPLIRRERPECTLTVVGRVPPPQILALARSDRRIRITGTVPDVRPYLWGSRVSVVPLRSGGGTRLKIYESMAGGVPVVSTTVGAEGLDVTHPSNIRLADTPAAFAGECLQLLNDEPARARIAAAGLQLVASRYSWDRIARDFEEILAGVAPCVG